MIDPYDFSKILKISSYLFFRFAFKSFEYTAEALLLDDMKIFGIIRITELFDKINFEIVVVLNPATNEITK